MVKTNESNSSRRRFLRNTIALSVGIAGNNFEANTRAVKQEAAMSTMSNIRIRKMLDLFNLKYPIFQAPTSGPAGEALAIAIANAGAMGALPLTWDSPEVAFRHVTKVKAATKGSFFVNYVLNFEPKSLNKALEAGAKIVQFSWGIPNKQIVSQLRSAGAKMGIQVTSSGSAKAALDAGADFLVCQGTEAGGHVQAHNSLADALAEVLQQANDIPVLASGGIATGHDIRKVIQAGASGAVLGSRFVATKESLAHPEYKDALITSNERDTVYTVCFDKGWSNALHRVLKNQTFNMWEAAGCPTAGSRPGEKDIVSVYDEIKTERYSPDTPVVGMTGTVTDMAMYAGQGVRNIKDIPSASDLILRLWEEYKAN